MATTAALVSFIQYASICERLFISIDAATQDSYDKVRVPVSKRLLKENRLDYLENNIKKFIKMRNQENEKRIENLLFSLGKHYILPLGHGNCGI